MKRRAIIVDLDGTLVDNFEFLIKPYNSKDWTPWVLEACNYPANVACKSIVSSMIKAGHTIIFLTARSGAAAAYTATLSWINKEFPKPFPFELLTNVHHANAVPFKRETYLNYIQDKYDVLFALDDDTAVCNMWLGLGVACFMKVNSIKP